MYISWTGQRQLQDTVGDRICWCAVNITRMASECPARCAIDRTPAVSKRLGCQQKKNWWSTFCYKKPANKRSQL